MKKVIRLARVQLWSVLADTLSIGRFKNKKPGLIYLGVGAFTIGMSLLSFFYNIIIGSGLLIFDSIDLLPPMMMSVTCIVLLMTTIWKVKGIVFGFRDYDTVMSMPVSTAGIVASRLIILYTINMLFVIIIVLPMMLAYGILVRPSPLFYILGLVSMLFLPLVPIVVASFIGTVIAYAASKFRHHNLVNILFSVGLVMVVLDLSFTMGESGEELVDMGKTLTAQVFSLYPLAKLYYGAVVGLDIVDFLLFTGVSALAFLLYIWLVQRIFKRLNTALMTGRTGSRFKLGRLKAASPLKALYRKELKRYFSSTPYVLNTGIGIVMLTVAVLALFFVDPATLFGEDLPEKYIKIIAPVILSFCIMMSSTTMASISLEGRNLWILKSLPVEPGTIYLAKILVNLTILSPVPVNALLLGVALGLDAPVILCMILFATLCGLFVSCFGLLVNLILPNFQWNNETIVVKQSAATMIVIFGGMGITLVLSAVFLVVEIILAYLICMLLLAAAIFSLYVVLMNYGKKRFTALN